MPATLTVPSGALWTKVPPPEASPSPGSAVPVAVIVSVSPTNPAGPTAVETAVPPPTAAPSTTLTTSNRTVGCLESPPAVLGTAVPHTTAAARQSRPTTELRDLIFLTPFPEGAGIVPHVRPSVGGDLGHRVGQRYRYRYQTIALPAPRCPDAGFHLPPPVDRAGPNRQHSGFSRQRAATPV